MATLPITLDWDAIQERNIDPFSPVDSDNHNKLLKILGNHKAYIKGFDVSFTVDADSNRMLATFSKGTAVIQYMCIDFQSSCNIVLFSCPILANEYAVVIEYKYRKIQPAPIAIIKTIPWEMVDSDIHLVLYKFWTGNWNVVPSMEDWINWISDPFNWIDMRTNEDNIPHWATETFVFRSGDTMTGPFYLFRTPQAEMEAATKGYVDYRIANHDELHEDTFLKLSGGIMSGYITLHDTPVQPMHATNKQYVDDEVQHAIDIGQASYVLKSGDVMLGRLFMAADPQNEKEPVTLKYGNDNYVNVTGDIMTGTLTVPQLNATGRMSLSIDNIEVGYINQYGLHGAVYFNDGTDIAEFYPHNIENDIIDVSELEGHCLLLDKDGNAIVSDKIASERFLGIVSTKASYYLGGTPDLNKEFFENKKIPVAIAGIAHNTLVESSITYPAGEYVVSTMEGKLMPLKEMSCINILAIVGKTLEPLKPGLNTIDVKVG